MYGAWRSSVARLLWEQIAVPPIFTIPEEVQGKHPLTPRTLGSVIPCSWCAEWLLPAVAIPLTLLRFGSEFFFGMALSFLIGGSLIGTTVFLSAQSHGPQGSRIHWIFGGVTTAFIAWAVLGILPFALGPLLGDLGWGLYMAASLGIAPFAMLIGGLGFAVLYQGAIDPRLAIRKTTVYGALGILSIILFGVIESLVSELLEARLGLPSMLGAALSGAVVAGMVIPLRGRFSRWMDRWMVEPEKVAGDAESSTIT